MKVFISGGCKNGKSTYAQRIAKKQQINELYYIATMNATDKEDEARITTHRQEREGWGFITLEQPRHIENILQYNQPNGSFLLDSLTALLANEMFSSQGVDYDACERISHGLTRVINEIENIVIVSDYIYSDALTYEPLTELYRKSLADLDKLAAKHCDVVLEAVYTRIIVHKGEDIWS
jgi:adenosylcobinamide kinase/adenosylcobinamide-phosphate guanylyltransferase